MANVTHAGISCDMLDAAEVPQPSPWTAVVVAGVAHAAKIFSCADLTVSCGMWQTQDLEGLLTLAGVPGAALPAAMAAVHVDAVARSVSVGRAGPTRRELRQWASLTRELLQRGWPAQEALAAAWRQVCARSACALALLTH